MRKLLLILFLIPIFAAAQTPMSKLIRKKASASSCGDADANAYITAAGITSPSDITAICDFVTREKAASRWGTEVQAFYILSNGSFNAVKYNLINTATFTLTTSGTITYSTGIGGGADPTSGAYYGTGYVPSTHSVSLNSAHVSLWSLENVNEASLDAGIGAALGASYLDVALFANVFYGRANVLSGGDYLSASLSTTEGFFLTNRTSSTAVEIIQNTTSLATGSITADYLPTSELLIFSSNLANFSTKKMCVVSIGAGISNTTDYYNSVSQLLTDLGVQ